MSANKSGQLFYKSFRAYKSKIGDGENIVTKALSQLGEVEKERICFTLGANPIVYFDYGRGSPWVFGAFSSLRSQISSGSLSETHSLVQSISDTGVVFGKAWSDRNNRLSLGVQVRLFFRYDFYDSVDNAILSSRQSMTKLIKEKGNKGTMSAVDLGGMWTVADFWFPTFAFAIRNLPFACQKDFLAQNSEERLKVCGVSLKGKIKNEESAHILDPTDIRFGFSLTPRVSRKFAFRLAIDMHKGYYKNGDNYYGSPGTSSEEQLHVGSEVFFGNPLKISPLAIRAGFNGQGMSGGLTLRTGRVVLDLAAYQQKISGIKKSKFENSYLAGFSIEF